MKDLDTSFLNISTIKLPVAAGRVLVAQPFLEEVWFDRGVISMIDYSRREGATGVVLNNNMNYTLDEVLDGVGKAGASVPVYCGGPLSQDRLYFIHTLGPEIIPDCREYTPGLYIGGDFTRAIAYVNEGYPVDGYMRFLIGYSGWSPAQLEEEVEAGTWAVVPGHVDNVELLTGGGVPYWYKIVRDMGAGYRPWQFIPHDMHAN